MTELEITGLVCLLLGALAGAAVTYIAMDLRPKK